MMSFARRRCSLSALSLLVLGACAPAVEVVRPSVILISLDTVRADHMTVYGYETRDTTPRLAELAGECIVYDQAYTTAPWTLVAHVGMLTGLYPEQHGVVEEDRAVSPDVPMLAERLASVGYDTLGFYHPVWVEPRHGFDRGFRVFEPHAHAHEAGDNMAEWLPTRDRSQPMFLFVHLFDAHGAGLHPQDRFVYVMPGKYLEAFAPDIADRFEPGDALELKSGRAKATEQQLADIRALYDAGLRFVDDIVCDWVDEWRASGLLDESVLIVTSDHGEALGYRGGELKGHGGMWQDGLLVPLMVRLPFAERGGTRIGRPVSHVDLVPSLLGWLGLPVDDWLPGYPILEQGRPDEAVLQASLENHFALVSWPRKVVGAANPNAGHEVDLAQDPNGLSPIAHLRDRDVFRGLRAEILSSWEAELARVPALDAEPAEAAGRSHAERNRLRALGYLEDP